MNSIFSINDIIFIVCQNMQKSMNEDNQDSLKPLRKWNVRRHLWLSQSFKHFCLCFFCFKKKNKCGKQFVFRFFPRIRKFANAVHSQNQMNWIFVDLADKYLKDHFQIFFLFRYFSCINNNKQSPIWNARDLFIEASDDFETRN